MSRGVILIAAGGTGGHLFPAAAFAEGCRARGFRVCLMTDERGRKYAANFPADLIEDVAQSIFLYDIKTVTPEAQKLAEIVTFLNQYFLIGLVMQLALTFANFPPTLRLALVFAVIERPTVPLPKPELPEEIWAKELLAVQPQVFVVETLTVAVPPAAPTVITDGVTAGNSAAFTYSAANRLKDASGPWGAKVYTFDKVGNRVQEDSTPVGGSKTSDVYAYPGSSNKLVTVTRGAQTVRAFTYDGAGNILTDDKAGSLTTYTYNKRNRLSSATSGALLWAYTYNGLEQLAIRTLSVGGSDVTHFVHDIYGNVIAETSGGGATGATGTQREYIWLVEAEIAPTFGARAQIDRPLAVVEDVETASPKLWHVHVDHLHRPVRMTDGAKATVWQAEWLPWGQAHSITGAGSFSYRLPGQWFQLEAGLHYNWHRHYDPSIGRFTQPDPLGFVDGPAVFGYAIGSPLLYADFAGLQVPSEPPGLRIIITDPATGREIVIYPTNPNRPTMPDGRSIPSPPTEWSSGTLQPEPLPHPIIKPTCEHIYSRCLARCASSPMCRRYRVVHFGCGALCSLGYHVCKKKGGPH